MESKLISDQINVIEIKMNFMNNENTDQTIPWAPEPIALRFWYRFKIVNLVSPTSTVWNICCCWTLGVDGSAVDTTGASVGEIVAAAWPEAIHIIISGENNI